MINAKIASWPHYSPAEIEAAKNVLKSGKVNYWTGNKTKEFENNFSKWCNVNYSIALANGSLALSSAYLSIGLKKGDEFITTPRSFIATTSSAALFGAKPKFADVDKNSGCITAKTIEPLITNKTKAISVVHLGGWPADMKSICELAAEYKIPVIEDCAQAHGAKIFLGNEFQNVGTFGDVSAWSFCQDKIISTGGEGGMITTNNKEIWLKIWSLKDHGKDYQLVHSKKTNNGFRWLHNSFGTNLRLTEFQSAIGILQLKNINSNWEKRNKNALYLASNLRKFNSLRIPMPESKIRHAWYRFYVYIKPEYISENWTRERIINEINKLGFPAFSGSCGEIYNEYCLKEFKNGNLKNAKLLSDTSLAFLIHPNITEAQMENYSKAICTVMTSASK